LYVVPAASHPSIYIFLFSYITFWLPKGIPPPPCRLPTAYKIICWLGWRLGLTLYLDSTKINSNLEFHFF
jgi:hypothetical protein